ncbi:unnamed protein product [Colletotrichum noveboracense]|uniref:ER transporter 6TM N-terminal domain-containing protein n=1 Tax=Colletotrichum noveboracense TaxID=2664923 RepID=A0A9W4S8Y1_9PEZI|nr:unnamed protein product [Colletotrichum noveboracense]
MAQPNPKCDDESRVQDDADAEHHFNIFNQPKRLPAWLDHFNAKDLKVLFKCSLAVWILTLFIFIKATLAVTGQAVFFGCIVLFMMPPSGVVLIHILSGLMICVGLAIGWAWGAITMKAALATRPQADLMRQFQELQQSPNAGQPDFLQIAIFEGRLLDVRVTATYFCMMGLFVYLMARIRVAAPNMTLVGIFALITADIYLTSAPTIPTFQGTIPKSMLIPVGIAVGIGAFCNVAIFPQSTSEIVLDGMADLLSPMKGFVKALTWQLANRQSRFSFDRLSQLKSQLAMAQKSLGSSVGFLALDFSFRKWSPEDVQSLQDPLRQVSVAFNGLLQLFVTMEEKSLKASALTEAAMALEDQKDSGNKQRPLAYHIARAIDLRDSVKHPDTEKMLDKTLDVVSSTAQPLLGALGQALDVIVSALQGVSTSSADLERQQMLDLLNEALIDFEASTQQLTALHSHLFDADGRVIYDQNGQVPPLYGLMTGLLLQERLIGLSRKTATMLKTVVKIDQSRPRKSLWLPKGLQRLFGLGLSQTETPSTTQGAVDLARTMSTVSRPEKKSRLFSRKKKTKEKTDDPNTAAELIKSMRNPTSRTRSKPSVIFLGLIHWFTDVEGIHALRTLIVTIALALPAVIPSSAGFYYREKGFWAMVMGQLAIEPYLSDLLSGIIIRTLSTIAGGIIGLVCWYIGAGSGPGNPYGLAAVMTVLIIPLMWWRLFTPPEHLAAGIMLAATAYMVVAYSWIDSHVPTYGNPGVGYQIFWRRVLLVLVGNASAMLIGLLPRPMTGSRQYRHILSTSLLGVKDRYALLVSTWRMPPGDLVQFIEKETAMCDGILDAIGRPIELTKFEFSTSNIDTETLRRATYLCRSINASLAELGLYMTELPLPLRARLMSSMSIDDENLVVDLMSTLSLVQQSLDSGEPLPALLPTPLIGRALRAREVQRAKQDDLNVREQLEGYEGRQLIGAINAFTRFLGAVDDLVMVTKKAVGETSHVNLEIFGKGV